MNLRVSAISNLGSTASMQRKKRSRVAKANWGTLKTGWYGSGNPFIAIMPIAADNPPNKIVNSKLTMINDGHECNGRPPMFSGYATKLIQYCREYAVAKPSS